MATLYTYCKLISDATELTFICLAVLFLIYNIRRSKRSNNCSSALTLPCNIILQLILMAIQSICFISIDID